MGKRILSLRQSPVTAAAQAQPFKRVNSKEDLLSTTSAESTIEDGGSKPAIERTISSSAEFEEAMKESTLQERALKALTRAHCAESLSCLIDLFKWETEEDETKRAELKTKIISEYMNKGTDKEIFLPESIREKVVSGKSTLNEVKSHVVNDLRFNTTLLKAIGAA